MTNGEKFKEIFPTFEFIKETEKDRTPQHQFLKVHGVNKMPYMEFDLGWWNAEYEEKTTKNDLGVLDELKAEITTLQNRCYALTKGTMCAFCKYKCEYKPESKEQKK